MTYPKADYYVCGDCGKVYYKVEGLSSHTQVVHGHKAEFGPPEKAA